MQTLLIVFLCIIWVVPMYRLYGRIGFNRGWALLALIPPIGMVLLWVAAFAKWPIADAAAVPLIGDRA